MTESTRNLDRNNLEEIAEFSAKNYARIIPIIFFYAALVTNSPRDRPLLEEAINYMLHSGMFKMAAACQAIMLEQFDEDKALNLRLLAQMQVVCSDQLNWSILYKMMGELEQTIEVLKEGLEANPDASNLQYYLLLAYLDANKLEQFRALLDEIAQNDPDTPLIEEMRSLLTMHGRLSALGSTPAPVRPIAPPTNRMENPKPKHKKKKR